MICGLQDTVCEIPRFFDALLLDLLLQMSPKASVLKERLHIRFAVYDLCLIALFGSLALNITAEIGS